MPVKRTATSEESFPTKIVQRVMHKLALEELSDTIATKLSEQILSRLQVDTLVATLLEKYGDELENAITTAIMETI